MLDVVRTCKYCSNQQTKRRLEGMKLLKIYVDDIICKFCDDPDKYLKIANSLHKNLQLTLKKVNMEGNLVSLDINVNVSTKSNIINHLYQKPTDTRMIMIFRSWILLQHWKNVIQGTVHSVFKATSNWLTLDQALEKNKTCWPAKSKP